MDKKSNHCSNLISHGGVDLNGDLQTKTQYNYRMRFIYIFIFSIILSGCGSSSMSDEEKINIAERACAEASATRNFETARRVKLINDARAKLGKGVYPFDPDFMIVYGNCLSIILDEDDLSPSNHWRLQ
jgi:hypothetical protein